MSEFALKTDLHLRIKEIWEYYFPCTATNTNFIKTTVIILLIAMERSSNKPGTPCPVPSKTIIINWLKGLFPDICSNLKIE